MLTILTYVFILLKFSESLLFEENQLCAVNDNTIHCRCQHQEDITLSSTTHFGLKNIIIEGCGTVQFPFGSIPHLQLDEISFMDINELDILPFSLVGITLHTLKIHNVRKFSVSPHGFVGLMNVEYVIIKNVSSHQLLEASFGGITSVENFRIEDSYFGDVEGGAFIFTNITYFYVFDSIFENLDVTSFIIHTAKEVEFSNCEFENVTFNSMHFSFVDSVFFDNCLFNILPPHSISTANVESFKFQGCVVCELNTHAFTSIEASTEIFITDNDFYSADNYSLYLTTEKFSEDVHINVCCNHFICDCNIYWLWKYNDTFLYHNVLSKSYCFGEDNVHLTDMIPVKDSHDNCKTFEKKSFTTPVTSDSTLIVNLGEISSAAVMLISTFSCLTIFFSFFFDLHICYYTLP